MARYKLKGKHYLNVPGTEWEHKENPAGGKVLRKVYKVPRYLDPDDPSDCNFTDSNGERSIIVTTKEDRQFPHDILFIGNPTPDMEPMDEEAEKIFAKLKPVWDATHPIESLPGTYGDGLADQMMEQMAKLQAGMSQGQPNVSVKEIEDLRAIVMEQQKQISQLLTLLTPATVKPTEGLQRRV